MQAAAADCRQKGAGGASRKRTLRWRCVCWTDSCGSRRRKARRLKACRLCNEIKDRSDFHRKSKSSDGLQAYCKSCNIQKVLIWQKSDPSRYNAYKRSVHHRKHGLTDEDFAAMREQQDGRCADCAESVKLEVDHDHGCCPGEYSCGSCVRGLVCRACNMKRLSADLAAQRAERPTDTIRK